MGKHMNEERQVHQLGSDVLESDLYDAGVFPCPVEGCDRGHEYFPTVGGRNSLIQHIEKDHPRWDGVDTTGNEVGGRALRVPSPPAPVGRGRVACSLLQLRLLQEQEADGGRAPCQPQ